MTSLSRRAILGAATLAAANLPRPGAAANEAVTIGWPVDVPSWDPNQRFVPDAQSLFKAVFDQPLTQDPQLRLIPSLITAWELAADARSLTLDLRDDVVFHDGSRMTAEDFRFTFFQRPRDNPRLDIANSWRKITDIEVVSATRAIMRFDSPAPTAPAWLAFMGSYVVPKDAMAAKGVEAFARTPVGSGPYRMVEHEMNARIVLERNPRYWGVPAKIERVTVQIIRDPSARVAAIQSGQVDITTNLPIREVTRLQRVPNVAAELLPISRVIILQVRTDQGFADPRVRLAAHHAIDKAALSQAFFGGAARPLSLSVTPGTPGDVAGFSFPFDVAKATALMAEAGFTPQRPIKVTLGTTNGHFPADYDIARAIVQMWRRVGIEAELNVLEYARYFELNRGGTLPEATVYTWDNATGDPEIFLGYMLNPRMPFAAARNTAFGDRILDLFNMADPVARIAGYQAVAREAVEAGVSMPLLQSVITVARKPGLEFTRYGNGWVLPHLLTWS